MAQSALGSRSLVDVNNLLGGCLIQQLAQVVVLNLGFVKFLGFDGFSQLFHGCLEMRLGRTVACSALEGLAMALFGTLDIWHFTNS